MGLTQHVYNGERQRIKEVTDVAFDGLTVRMMTIELSRELVGCRITKIYQPTRYNLIFHCRKPGSAVQLLISGHPQYARIHLTTASIPNPPAPPSFCMLLRKHLEGGKITSISQVDFERIVQIDVENLNEQGELVTKRLLVEIMGRHSNVLILDSDHTTILDAMIRVTDSMSRYRQVEPGETYSFPPAQDKLDPFFTNWQQFSSRISPAVPNQKLFQLLVDTYKGISPTTAKEVVARTGLDPNATRAQLEDVGKLWNAFQDLLKNTTAGRYQPSVAVDIEHNPVDFAPFPLTTKGVSYVSTNTLSEAIDRYYQYKEEQEKQKHLAGELRQVVSTHLRRIDNKIEKQEAALQEAQDAEKYRIQGELLTANIYRISRGMTSITVENFYDPPTKVTIALDARLSPAENAQKLFKQYTKLKNSLVATSEQLAASKAEKKYLLDVLTSIELAESTADLAEIKEELQAGGYLTSPKQQVQSRQKQKTSSSPLRFESSDGFTIYVGRNNRQNDRVTFRIGKPDDIWLHVKNIPGSHVIIVTESRSVPNTTLEEAAILAAYYSRARNSTNVAVDYTQRKNVRKPSGTRPGQVIYDHYTTLFVTPDPEKVAAIKRIANDG